MKGVEIILSAQPRGVFLEGIIQGTPQPGTAMTVAVGVPFTNGRPNWVAYAGSANGDPRLCAILLNDWLQGMPFNGIYTSGQRGLLYAPLAGEEMNILVAPQVGTGSANAYTIGERFIPTAATGQFTATSVTSSTAAWFMCMEHVDIPPDVAGLVWAQKQI